MVCECVCVYNTIIIICMENAWSVQKPAMLKVICICTHTRTRTVHSACLVIEFILQVFRLMIDLQLQGLIKRKII